MYHRHAHLVPPEELPQAGKKNQPNRKRQGPLVVEGYGNRGRAVPENASKDGRACAQNNHYGNNA